MYDFEVAIKEEDRYEFLKEVTRQEIYKYLVKQYYEAKILTHIQSSFTKLKLAQQAYEDNEKEIT
jgi:hypothetical protein